MSFEARIDEHSAHIETRPEFGKPVTFVVQRKVTEIGRGRGYWSPRTDERYVVGLKGSSGSGFSQHKSFDTACRAALSRARRYHEAYSVPRGLRAVSS